MRILALFILALGCGSGGPPFPGQSEPYATGLIVPDDWEAQAVFEQVAIPTAMPEEFGYENLPPIQNQGRCGSCVAFATAAVLEFLELGITGEFSDLAEQTIVSSCSNSVSCQGGWFSSFDYTTKFGLPLEKDDPYQARNTRCKQGLKPKAKTARYSYLGEKGRQPSTDEIKAAIMTYGVVAVSVAAGGSFKSYRGGLYTACNANRTNHAVALTGWKTVDGQTYWRLRNSWGQSWGGSEKGYMWILAEKNGRKCNAVAQTVVFATYNYDK